MQYSRMLPLQRLMPAIWIAAAGIPMAGVAFALAES
jgi:hypothetical protein